MLFLLAPAAVPAAPPVARAEPRILTIKPLDTPIAGRAVRIEIKVKDPLAAINGVQADFGDGRDSIKQSACRPRDVLTPPFRPGTQVTFVLTHAYVLPGDYDVKVTATSGDCVIGPLMAKRALRVRVRAPRPSDSLPAVPAVAAQAGGCPGASDLPTRLTLERSWRATWCLANAVRISRGLGKLRSNRRLRLASGNHARDMVARGYFSHRSPGGSEFVDRLRRARYRPEGAAENIGAGSDALATPMAMLISWMESPPHRVNLLEPDYDEVGVGVTLGFPAGGAGGTYVMGLGHR
jgi:uncharacterized protein YkwD